MPTPRTPVEFVKKLGDGNVDRVGNEVTIGAGAANIGDVDVLSIAAGDNNIGNVDVASIAAGDNNIGNVDIASVIPGTGATELGKAEDTAHVSGHTGVMLLAVRKNTAAALADTDSDYAPVEVDAAGRIWINTGRGVVYPRSTTTVTIANNASLSDAADLGTGTLLGVITDSAWDTAKMTFQVSSDNITFGNLYKDSDGSEYGPTTALPAAAVSMAVDPSYFIPFRYVKIRSGTAASAVNQGGATVVTLIYQTLA